MDSRPRSSPNRQRAPSTPRVISGFRSTTFNERLNPILPVPPRVGRGLSITVKQPRKPKNLPTPPRISNENRRRRAPSAPRVISGFRSTTFNERLDPILPAPPRAGPGLNVTVHQSRNSRSLPAPPRISDENRQRRRRGRPGRPRRDMEEIFESSSRRRQSPKHIAYIPEARRPSDRDLSPISEDDSDSVSKRCSILLCIFRNRAHGWQSHRLHVHPPENTTDKELFKHIRSAYRHELQGLWRRYFSLKTLKYIAPLLYRKDEVPMRQEPSSFYAQQDIMFCYQNYPKIDTENEWVRWVEKLKSDPDERYGLEFVEGWDGQRIILLGTVVLLVIVGLSAIWVIKGGDLQTVFTVMGFTLSMATTGVALLAIYDQIDR